MRPNNQNPESDTETETESSSVQSPEQVVEFKVKRQAAKRAFHSIQSQVDEVEQQIKSENKNARTLLPLLLLLVVLILGLTFFPQIYRFISSLLHVS
jgi:uncharacterized protein HemX